VVNELGLSAGSAVAREMKKGPSGRTTPERKLNMLRFILPAPPGASSQTSACVNLQERFGKRFKVRYEESYFAQYGPRSLVVDPWLMVIPCVGGEIYPHGGDTLAAYLRSGPRGKELRRLGCVRVKTDGSDGTTVLFHVADFDQVARIMQPRRRRTATEKVRAHLAVVGVKTRFRDGVGLRPEGLESTIGGRVDI